MDPLTKNLLSRLGRTHGQPKLPPVNNVSFINLQEGLTGAETALHNARVALDQLQAARIVVPRNVRAIRRARRTLHRRMALLEASEQEHFAKHYASNDRTVLQGWREWKEEKLKDELNDLRTAARHHVDQAEFDETHGYADNLAVRGARSAQAGATALQHANDLWYDGLLRKTTRPPGLHQYGEIMRTTTQDVRNLLAQAEQLDPANALRGDTIASIQQSLTNAQTYERLFKHIATNDWAM